MRPIVVLRHGCVKPEDVEEVRREGYLPVHAVSTDDMRLAETLTAWDLFAAAAISDGATINEAVSMADTMMARRGRRGE